MIFNVIVDNKNIFNMIFLPLAVKIARQLKMFGFEVKSGPYVTTSACINIIFGAHSNPLFWQSVADEQDIFVNCEPLYDSDWRLSNLDYVNLVRQSRVLEIYQDNKNWSRDPKILVLPPLFESIANNKKFEFIDGNKKNILFIGSINAKRRVFLEGLKEQLADVNCGFGIFGEELKKTIERSSFFLNLNYYENAMFNKYRFSLCLGSNSVYVGELGQLTDDVDIFLKSALPMVKNEVCPKDIVDFIGDPIAVSNAMAAQHRAASLLDNLFVDHLERAVGEWT